MLRQWRTALRGLLLALVGTLVASPLWAAKPGELRREAEQLVTEALFHESLGLNEDRAKLLAEAAEKSPGSSRIKWAQGLVKYQDRWVSIDELSGLTRASAAFARYEKRRSDFPDNAVGQLALARYCAKQGLAAQTRAHLVRVLEHDPNQLAARRELGFVQVNGKWLHQDDVALAARTAAQQRENFARWQKRILDIRHDLTARARAQREAAAKRLVQIDDPAAIPALEMLLCYQEPIIAAQAIAAIGAMTAPDASLALARVAVYAPADAIREAAGVKLHGRPFEQYVPNLLAALGSTIEARENVALDRNGRLIYQQVFVREGQERNQVLVQGTEYRRQYVGGGSRRFAEWQAGLDMARENATATQRVALENLNTIERNERITQALASGTEQTIANDPKLWWNWWNDYNDIKTEGTKPVEVQVAVRSVNVFDGVPGDSGSGNQSGGTFGGGSSSSGGRRHECLVAGTVVRTSTGLVPIEQIRVGDLVLSQHPDTGELALKPVLKTTITPEGPLLRVELGNYDTFRCTNGHLFWVSGEGWRQARQLRSGAQLHTPHGAVTVSDVQTDKTEKTYNLIVADFHTYFAGERGVLSHDNTLRQPTLPVVPGVVVK